MSPPDLPKVPIALSSVRTRAFAVHILTALGAAFALMALLEAVREQWATMFAWLGAALLIDAIDGPMARRFDVVRKLPEWSGETLDLVVDFVTYVFVPAYAIMASKMLLPVAAPLLGCAIVVTGALYFADRRMKVDDNHFRGFPALWNVAALYLFTLKLSPILSSLVVTGLLVLTFVPFHVIHPIRVTRFRLLNLSLMVLWGGLAVWIIARDLQASQVASIIFCIIAIYVLVSDSAMRLVARFRKLSNPAQVHLRESERRHD